MLEIDRLPLRPLFFVFSVAYLILAMNLPVTIHTYAGHDDALFWQNAYQIVKGNWLGAYNQMTLAKGPGFPLFLAANAVLGIPVTLLIALLYLFACGLIVNILRELGLNRYLVLTIFVVILFHPELFPTRIIRDNIYPALSLIIISGVIRLVFAPLQQDRRLMSVVPYGFVFGFFWMTREEGIWIVPGLLFLLLLRTLQLKKQNLPIKDIFYRFACFLLIATMFVVLIALINFYKYGKFEVVDVKGQAFSQALKSLNSVDAGSDLPYVPVSFDKRQEIYKVSPTFAQLKDYFEDKGKGWTTSDGCNIYPWTCGDYAGGWFMWALRDAVAIKGYYESPVRAAEFYNNITKEIETACDMGVIKCRAHPIPLMPNIAMTQLKEFPEKTVAALKLAMVQFPMPATGDPSYEPLNQLQRIRLFLRSPLTTLAPSEQRIELSGWFYSNNLDWIVLNCSMNGTKIKRYVDRISSPDIVEHFKDPNANFQRFSISVPKNEDCSISIEFLPSNNLPIEALLEKTGGHSVGENGTLYVDQILQANVHSAQDLLLKIKNSLANIYKLIIPILVLLGAFSYFVYLILILIGKTPVNDTFVISSMMWCLFFSRILLLILVDISSFPAIEGLYMSAAFPILCLAAFLSLQLIFCKIKFKFGS
jgi:hypothetical protein